MKFNSYNRFTITKPNMVAINSADSLYDLKWNGFIGLKPPTDATQKSFSVID